MSCYSLFHILYSIESYSVWTSILLYFRYPTNMKSYSSNVNCGCNINWSENWIAWYTKPKQLINVERLLTSKRIHTKYMWNDFESFVSIIKMKRKLSHACWIVYKINKLNFVRLILKKYSKSNLFTITMITHNCIVDKCNYNKYCT